MKKMIYVLLLLANTSSSAWAVAKIITYTNTGVPLVVLEKTLSAMQMGAIRYVQIRTTNSAPSWQDWQTSICAESPTGNFPTLPPSPYLTTSMSDNDCKTTNYGVWWSGNIDSCLNNTGYCDDNIFIGSQGLAEYTTKSQFRQGFLAIVSGKIAMEMRINEQLIPPIAAPSEIGLPDHSKYCSSITAKSYADGSGEIKCTLQNMADTTVNNKIITLPRSAIGVWTCSTDLDATGQFKYAGLCQY